MNDRLASISKPARWTVLLLIIPILLGGCGVLPIATTPTAPPVPTAPPAPTTQPTEAPAPTEAALSPAQIVEELTASTVMIRSDFPETPVEDAGTGSGTGVVLTDDGYILTNAHVVQGASSWAVFTSGSSSSRPARLIGANGCDDIALLKVDDTSELKPAVLGTSADVIVAEEVIALGYPDSFDLGSNISVNKGIVSQTKRQIDNYDSLIQTDAAINHGNSGGPLVNMRGQVIGINTLSSAKATNINFAISVDKAKGVIEQLKKNPHSQWLGMNLLPNDYAEANDYFGGEGGMIVAGVDTGSPAKRAGVVPADLLTKIEDTTVDTLADVCKILRSHNDGDRLKMEFLRVADANKDFLEGEIALGDSQANVEPLKQVASADQPTPDDAQGNSDNLNYVDYDFQSDNGDWITGENDHYALAIENGIYSIKLKEPNLYAAWPAKNIPDGADMGVVATLQTNGNARAGVATRYSENGDKESYYACWIDGGNQYGCVAYVNSELTTLREVTQSDAIQSGKPNKLILTAEGDKVSFSINDTDVESFQISLLTHGRPAIYVENYDDPAGVDVGHVIVVTPK